MVRPGHRTHDPLPARAILPRHPARRTAQPEGTRGRYERGLVSQTPPHLQRYTRRCTATLLAGTGFCHVLPSRQGEETPPSAPGRHYLCALPRCLMAKVEVSCCPVFPFKDGAYFLIWPQLHCRPGTIVGLGHTKHGMCGRNAFGSNTRFSSL